MPTYTRRMAGRRSPVTRLVVVATAVSCAVPLAVASAAPLRPAVTVNPSSDWIVIRHVTGQPAWRSMVVVVTAADVAAVRPFSPFDGFTRLSPRRIIIWSTNIGAKLPARPMAWPPRLSPSRVDHGWEGQPAANIQQRLKFGRVRGWDIDVRVYFATQHPGNRLLARAQAELARLHA